VDEKVLGVWKDITKNVFPSGKTSDKGEIKK